ncbi:MAG: metal ABC transporter permease, partial [Candidatus Hecatellales archaeon]
MLESLLQYEFVRNAVYAGILASVVCGLLGPYIVVKRIVFISGGISHASFGGVGLGYLLGGSPILGAMGFAVASALGIGVVSRRFRQQEDAVIGIVWAVGMALGVVFIALKPGYAPNLLSYLFGSILTVTSSDLALMLTVTGVTALTILLLYKEFLALAFDEEYAWTAGVPVEPLYLTLLALIGLTVVILMRVVGIILLIALLTIPASISLQYTYNMKKMMVLSTLLGAAFTLGGLTLSYYVNLPPGATIILLAAATHL